MKGDEGGWRGMEGDGGGRFLLACCRSHIIPNTDRDDLSCWYYM